MSVDPRLLSALEAQLAQRPHGSTRVGWKVGAGERERIGDDSEEIVAANIFHRAVAFGPPRAALPGRIEARLVVNGHVERTRVAGFDPNERVRPVAGVLAAAGERLQDGDRVITGSIAQVPVAQGDEVAADLGALGIVRLSIA